MFGIAKDIEDRVSAYRGQPEQLTQRYQQGRDLMDLLALQKLKTEKEEAKRQLALQAQQLPTIADQREQQVMDLIKEGMALDPANSGIAAQLQEPIGFAQGGIVGYNTGGGPLGEGGGTEDEEVISQLGTGMAPVLAAIARGLGAIPRAWKRGQSPDAIVAERLRRVAEEGQTPAPEATPAEEAPAAPEAAVAPEAAPPDEAAQAMAEFNAALDGAGPAPAAEQANFVPQEAQEYMRGALTAEVDDPYAGIDRFKEALGLGQLMEERKAAQEARRARYEAENTPEKRRREALRAFLQAGSRGTGIASALGLGSRGMSEAEAQQRARDEAFHTANLADIEGQIAEAVGLGKAGMDAGLQVTQMAQAKANAALTGALEMARQEGSLYDARMQRDLDRAMNDARIQATLTAAATKGADSGELSKFVFDAFMKAYMDPTIPADKRYAAAVDAIASLRAVLGTYGGMGGGDVLSDEPPELESP